MIDDEILDLFRQESEEHLLALETSLLDLESADEPSSRRSIIDDVFRHAHSLKGSARVMDLSDLQDRAQELEDTLDELRENPESATKDSIDKALSEFDGVKTAYDAWIAGDESESEQVSSETHSSEKTSDLAVPENAVRSHDQERPNESRSDTREDSKKALQPRPTTKPAIIRGNKGAEERFVVRVPAERLDRMLSLAGEVRVSQRGSDAHENQITILREVLASMLSECKRFEEKLPQMNSNADAVSIRELVEGPIHQLHTQLEGAAERLQQVQSDIGKQRFREELLVEELEQDIRTARLVPLSNLTDPMRRTVRDLVQSLGKSIAYAPNVGGILLDKAVMESLKDPLMHMIRNAADHGIESPDDRVAAGKKEQGTIGITASRRAESVLIRISDDGGGIDFDRIRQKLKEGGQDHAEVMTMSHQELAKFLFQAGFSTKQEATSVSGRGVGMDVVLDSIHRMQGTVELENSSSQGTTFLITVPVTISTARILTVISGGQRYGIPTSSLTRTGRLKAETLREIEGCLILTVDDVPVRWIELSDLVGGVSSLGKGPLPGQGSADSGVSEWLPYLLLSHEGRQLALAVEECEDESEVILKSLEFPLTETKEVIGGTIRPDGSAQLVLDPGWLMSKALNVERRAVQESISPSAQVLVVDDSPTTRAIVRNFLAVAGYAVQTAADGVEALERLRTRPFDLVVSDVEMPRMNGFELTRQVKSRFNLPVILITGLAKEEHRLEGMKAGADAYVVKSTFESDGLLETVQQLV